MAASASVSLEISVHMSLLLLGNSLALLLALEAKRDHGYKYCVAHQESQPMNKKGEYENSYFR